MNNEQKNLLKARAHVLKPVVITGQHGISPAVLNEIDLALEHHELIKIRVNAADREDRKAMTESILAASRAELVQSIGHIVTVYRKRPPKK